jgi:hypothetical protein
VRGNGGAQERCGTFKSEIEDRKSSAPHYSRGREADEEVFAHKDLELGGEECIIHLERDRVRSSLLDHMNRRGEK